LYKKTSNLGDYDAVWKMGELYYSGISVEQDYEKAIKFYTDAINMVAMMLIIHWQICMKLASA